MSCRSEHAPGGVPMMVVNDYAGNQMSSVACGFFASMLAPTGTGSGESQKPQGEPKLPKK